VFWLIIIHLLILYFLSMCSRSAYENSVFCNKFHRQQTGWRECNFCNKVKWWFIYFIWFLFWPSLSFLGHWSLFDSVLQPIHCGCIVSRSMFEYLDFGGIGCVSCVNTSQHNMVSLIWIVSCLNFVSHL
jgi:hypothetical protein